MHPPEDNTSQITFRPQKLQISETNTIKKKYKLELEKVQIERGRSMYTTKTGVTSSVAAET